MRAERLVVIGGGVGGLTTAALAARDAFDVTLLEAQPATGGKLRALSPDGVTPVDAGPTVFTKRDIFDAIFDVCGESLDDHLTLRPTGILARHAWSDGSRLDLFADDARSRDAVGDFAGADAARAFARFRAESRRIHDILDVPFMRRAKTGPLGLCRNIGLTRLSDLLAIRPYETLWSALNKHFADPRLRQLFARYATYCGSSPFVAPATLMLIAHVEASGVWRIEGGMHRLAAALTGLAERAGARIRTGAPVARIVVEEGRATGVILASGERLGAECVVVAADPATLAAGRFGEPARRAVGKIPVRARSLSALVWLAKVRASGTLLDHHNVFFSNDYAAEFADLAAGRVPTAPSTYVCATGHGPSPEHVQIIVNAPPDGDTHAYSSKEIDRCRTRMLASLQATGTRLTIEAERVLTPTDFEALNPSTGGALYGRASHGWGASFLRQGTRTRIHGVYCAGGSTHPGAGVPMAALSGRLAAACLRSDRDSIARSRRAGIAGGISTRSPMTVRTG